MKFRKAILFLLCITPGIIGTTAQSQITNEKRIYKHLSDEFTKALNDSIPALGSFIVSQNDTLIYAQYFHGADENTSFNVKSVTKSIVSVLTGIAMDRHLLTDLNTPVLKILTEYNFARNGFSNVWHSEDKRINDSIRNTITLKDLLTMRGGFEWNESGVIAQTMIGSSDPVKFTLDLPFDEYPGTRFNYNTGETIVFGAALSRIVNMGLK